MSLIKAVFFVCIFVLCACSYVPGETLVVVFVFGGLDIFTGYTLSLKIYQQAA